MKNHFVALFVILLVAGCSKGTKITSAKDGNPGNLNSRQDVTDEIFENTCEIDHSNLNVSVSSEMHRIIIHNVKNGAICGSKDAGKSWTLLGHVLLPIEGGIWKPTQKQFKVYAFNFLRGNSNVFASAINNLHIRFSDPVGYELPRDTKVPPLPAHGVSFAPREMLSGNPLDLLDEDGKRRCGITDIPGGKGIFSGEWTSRIGASAFMGNGKTFSAIPYDLGPNSADPERSYILILNPNPVQKVEYLEFENKKDGLAFAKFENQDPKPIARVLQAVKGIGRFDGSQFLQRPGQVRANHPGVLDIGTTDINTDPTIPQNINPPAYLNVDNFGGFQIVPSHHYYDDSMAKNPKGIANEVYLVVGPLDAQGIPQRYDLGLEGTFPLFNGGLLAGNGTTYFQFGEGTEYIELNDAVKLGLFKHTEKVKTLDSNGNPVLDSNGKPVTTDQVVRVDHLRGKILDVLSGVTKIKLVMP